MEKHTCSVDDCDKPVKRLTLCYGHYMKQWRYGTPTPDLTPRWVDIRGERFGTLTVVERSGPAWACSCDCGESRVVSAGDLNRYGSSSTCGVMGKHLDPEPGYRAVHDRLKAKQGPAKRHTCVDCSNTAAHWSYNHDDPNERTDRTLSTGPMHYGLSSEHYSPRCVSCHKRFDLDVLSRTPIMH